jgi:hypothetical protein
MKKKILLLSVLLVILFGVYLGYRGYVQHKLENEQAAQALSREIAERERLAELERRASAEAEAHRLAEMQARREAEDSERRLADLQAAQDRATAERAAAEAALARMQEETERLRAEKEAAQGESRRLAELREQESAAANAARLAALEKLRALEQEKRDLTDREAARLAALRRQAELEALAYRNAAPAERIVYPPDYKPRDHHNLRATLEWETYRKAGATIPSVPEPELAKTEK